MNNTIASKTMCFAHAYPMIQPSPELEKKIHEQFDVYNAVYNNCAHLIKRHPNYKLASIESFINYINETCLPPGPFGFISTVGEPLIILGAIKDFYHDLQNNRVWEKNSQALLKSLTIPFDNTNNSKNLSLQSDITMHIPIFGNLKLLTAMSSAKIGELSSTPTSMLIKVEITYNKNTNQYQIVLVKLIMVEPDSLVDYSNMIGLYVSNTDLYTITLSNGSSISASSELSNILCRAKQWIKRYKSPSETHSMKQKLLNRITDANAEYNGLAASWYKSIAVNLVNNYEIIKIENQPRLDMIDLIPEYPDLRFRGNTWLQFMSFLYEITKQYKKKLIPVYRSPNNLLRCNKCGILDSTTHIQTSSTTWVCTYCNTEHNILVNAARNILKSDILTNIHSSDINYKLVSY